MSLRSTNARPKPKTWADLFRKQDPNETTTENMKTLNNDDTVVNNTVALYNQVESIQESAAVIIPGAAKTVKSIHHCFNDLGRERIIGVHRLKQYAPFKEAPADHLVSPFQPPSTRESANTKIPSFDDFINTGREGGIANCTCSADETLDHLESKPATLWVSGHHLQQFYGKSKKANEVATDILETIPKDMSREEQAQKANEFYDQLLFLWCIEKGYASSIAFKDPPDSDLLQETIEDINGLLITNNPPEPRDKDADAPKTGNRTGPDPNNNRNPDDDHSAGHRRGHRHTARSPSNPRSETYRGHSRGRSRNSRSPSRRHRSRSRSRGHGRKRPEHRGGRDGYRHHSRDRNQRDERDYRRTSRSPRRSPSRSSNGGSRAYGPYNDHERTHNDPLTAALVQGITALTKSQLEIAEREKRKKSVLSRLSQRQVFLFDALSARSWSDPNPLKTREAEMMLEDRDVERNWNLLIDMTEKWPGSISKPAFIQFLTKGFVSQDRPGGFTVFMFGPPKKTTIGRKDRKRNLRNVLGKRGEFDEEDLEFYAKNEFFLPKSVYEAEGQLLMAVRTLDLFMHTKSIASDGYRYGLEFLDDRRQIFHDRQEKDKLFMARYLNLLDNAFQNFASKLGSYHEYRDPIGEARHTLRRRMEKDVDRIMRDIDYDVFPRLALPPRLTEPEAQSSNPKKQKTKEKSQANTNPDETGPTETPSWWKTNPSPASEWAIPSGKLFKDFFDTTTATGRANLARMPKAKHHNNKVRLRRNICARYQCEGECKPSCNLTHIPPSRMNDEINQEVKEAFRIAYS